MTTNMPCLPGPDAYNRLSFTQARLALLMKCTCPSEALGEVTSASAALTKGGPSHQLVNRLRIFGLVIKPPILTQS